jgi:hypothetical protein
MENLPVYISIIFALTTFLTVWIFYKATNRSKTTLIVLISWLVLQTIISLTGFYTFTETFPPRFVLLVLPPNLFILGLFATRIGRHFIESLNASILTIIHVIRIPIEIVLFCLFINKAVPQLMTFEGRNFDILSGITAPVIYYFGFIKKGISKNIILLWNFICLGLLLNIIVLAVFSAPFTFQKLGFEQPNIAVLYFPFVWLPCCVVPLILLSHLATIRQIIIKPKT